MRLLNRAYGEQDLTTSRDPSSGKAPAVKARAPAPWSRRSTSGCLVSIVGQTLGGTAAAATGGGRNPTMILAPFRVAQKPTNHSIQPKDGFQLAFEGRWPHDFSYRLAPRRVDSSGALDLRRRNLTFKRGVCRSSGDEVRHDADDGLLAGCRIVARDSGDDRV